MEQERVASLGRVRMQKANLLQKLGENRDRHREEFKDSLEGYWDALATEIGALHDKISTSMMKHIEKAQAKDEDTRISWGGFSVDIKKPNDHTDDFERAIAKLECDLADKVDLNSQEFDRYVLNKWEWTQEHMTSITSFAPSHLANY